MPYTANQVTEFPQKGNRTDLAPSEAEGPSYIGSSEATGAGHEQSSEREEDPNQGFYTGPIKPSFNSGPNGRKTSFDAT